MTKDEYFNMLSVLKSIGFKVYSIYREESRFLENTYFDKLTKVVWAICIGVMAYLLISEIKDEQDSVWISVGLVSLCIGLIMIISIFNFFQTPNSNIFINYEEFMHQSVQKYFGELNATNKVGLRFTVSNNDINWIEISVPKNLQMPFSELQIKKHLELLKQKPTDGKQNSPKLVAVVETAEEAEALNIKIMNQRAAHLSSNQTHNLGSGYGSEDIPIKTKNKRKQTISSEDYEDEDDVESLNMYQTPF